MGAGADAQTPETGVDLGVRLSTRLQVETVDVGNGKPNATANRVPTVGRDRMFILLDRFMLTAMSVRRSTG